MPSYNIAGFVKKTYTCIVSRFRQKLNTRIKFCRLRAIKMRRKNVKIVVDKAAAIPYNNCCR